MVRVLDATGSGKQEVAVEAEVSFEGHAEFILLSEDVEEGNCDLRFVVLQSQFEVGVVGQIPELTEANALLISKHIHVASAIVYVALNRIDDSVIGCFRPDQRIQVDADAIEPIVIPEDTLLM